MFALYLLDVYVMQLKLNKEVYVDTGGLKLVVKVGFLNFPTTEVVERYRYIKDEEKIYVYGFKSGQSYHFSMMCDELVRKMKRVKLRIGVFRVDDDFPICHVHTYVNGCACDLGLVGIANPAALVFRGPFDLMDPGNSFAGQLELDVTVTNLGRILVTPYGLAPNCFVFKNSPEGPEFKCNSKESQRKSGEINKTEENNLASMDTVVLDKLLDTSPPGNLMREIAAISPGAGRLALGSPPPKLPRPPLVDPTTVRRRRRGRKGRRKK
ncbi:unnamed protein product [Xylocopa violacea]|uniref:Uncharacterized protein n=1 Tax=Xylocopa violacea TaxID=135666 RepID=A0ABP1N4Z5_XYLVO